MSTAVLTFPTGESLTFPASAPDPVEPKKSNHQANIVRIPIIFPHNNADSLELIVINGYQVVSRKGQFKIGDLGVYIQPDSVVPQTEPFRFIWEQYVGLDGNVPEKHRRITVRKFRGEWSEGLLLPLSDFGLIPTRDNEGTSIVSIEDLNITAGRVLRSIYHEGDDVSDLTGITHYDPDAGTEATHGNTVAAPRRKYPRTLKGWFFWLLFTLGWKKARESFAQEVSFHLPEYDVEAFKNHANTFEDGEIVVITEKVHGSNARFVYLDDTLYTGSRTQWKAPDSKTVWTRAVSEIPWIADWCRAHPGYALYGEVTPTQKGFDYGSKDAQFFLFDILDPNGKWVPFGDYHTLDLSSKNSNYGEPDVLVPVLYIGPFSKEIALLYVDGPSVAAKGKHVREGVVIKSLDENGRTGRGRKLLKIVSNTFLEKDSK